jgi:GntR family transcriptional regulator, arabinose operon transcriptional repressor
MKAVRSNHRTAAREATEPEKPKYERLRQFFVEEILAGRLRPGDMLPTEQQLAASYAIARSTVRQALAELERDGLIQRIQGKGTFIHEEARARLRKGLDVFALVLPETQSGFYPSLQRSFDEAAGRVHNQILVCQSNNNLDRQGNVILQLIDKEVAGVAIVPVTIPATPVYQIRQIQRAGIPVVFCHRRVEGVRAPLLAIPFRDVGRLAGRALVERGHRRVAFFAPHRSEPSMGYLTGLRDVLPSGSLADEHAVFFGPEAVPDPEVHEPELLAALTAVLDHRERPTAIFASFDSTAEMIYLLLMRLGLRVPEDISLIGFGGTMRGGATLRCITSVTVDEVQIGHRAVELLDRMRRHELPLDSNETFTMSIGLSDGQTLGPAPRKGK